MVNKKVFDRFADQNGFIKTGTPLPMDGAQKAALNRRGNILYNSGNIEEARRIFLTTGYSDGISRVGDYYRTHSRPLDALKMYRAAPDRSKLEPLVMQLASIIQIFFNDDEEGLSDE